MKIISNTVDQENLNDRIFDADLSTAKALVKKMDTKLKGCLNGDVANESYTEKLETENIKKLSNGIRNGFKDSSNRPSLHTNGSIDFDAISNDDFHLELEASDEDNQTEEINSPLDTSKSKGLIPKTTTNFEKNLTPPVSVEVDEIQDVQKGIDEVESITENLNTSEDMALVENNSVAIKLDSLLDCEESKNICLNTDQKEEETAEEECFYTLSPNNCENTDDGIEVNVVFSEVVIESVETVNSEKIKGSNLEGELCEADLNKCNKNNKSESKELSLNDIESETNDNNVNESSSEKCGAESLSSCVKEVEMSVDDQKDLRKRFPENSSKKLDVSNASIVPLVFNSVESNDSIENVMEETSLDEVILNSNDVSNELVTTVNESGICCSATTVDVDKTDKTLKCVNVNNEGDNLSLEPVYNKHTDSNVKTKLTKSSSGEEIFLSDVMESVAENFEEQRNSFDDDDFGNIVISTSTAEDNSTPTAGVQLIKKRKSLSASQESGGTVNDPDEWLVLDELDESYSSSDEQTVGKSEKMNCLNKDVASEFKEKHELEDDKSTVDILQTEHCINDNIETEKVDLVDVDESISLTIEPFDIVNNSDTEFAIVDEINEDAEQSIPEDNESVILNIENVTNVSVEKISEEVDLISFPDEVGSTFNNGEQIIVKSSKESTNKDTEDTLFEQDDQNVLNNEKLNNADLEVSKATDSTSLNTNEVSCVINIDESVAVVINEESSNAIKETMSNNIKDDKPTVVNAEINNMDVDDTDVKETDQIVLKNGNFENKVWDVVIESEVSESVTKDYSSIEGIIVESKDELHTNIEDIIVESKDELHTNIEDTAVESKDELLNVLEEGTISDNKINKSINSGKSTESEIMDFETSKLDNEILLDAESCNTVKHEDSEKVSALLIEELTCKVESEEPYTQTDGNLKANKESENEECKQYNTKNQLDFEEAAEFKHSKNVSISLSKTTYKIEEDVPVTLGKRLASSSNEVKEVVTKRLKSEDETNLLKVEAYVSMPCSITNEIKVDSTGSKLKRSNSDNELESDVVKKPKFCSEEEEKELAVCSDVVEECLKFAESDGKISEKLDKTTVKSIPEVKNSSDSDVNYIRNILKSSIGTVGGNKSDIIKSNNKFRRKESCNQGSTLDLNKQKKVRGLNKLTNEKTKISWKTVTNLDLAIETVVEESLMDPEKKIPLLKKFHKSQLKNLTRHDLEELVIVKLCEAITDRSVIGELRQRCHKVEQIHDQWRKKAMQMEKSHRELEMVLKRYLQEVSNTKKERQPLPIKVTRSVGLQVVLASSANTVRQKSSNSLQHSTHQRKQNAVPVKVAYTVTPKPSTPVVTTPVVDLQSPAKTPGPTRSRSSISPAVLPVTPAASPKPSSRSSSLEVIDLTDKEEKNKQLQQQQQQQQQQKLKQQMIQQQQQQKQKQQVLQQKQKQLGQQNQQVTQQNQLKQTPHQNVQKQLQVQQPKTQQSPQQNVGGRVPTTVPQNGLRLVQAHQLTTNTPTQGMAILVPTSAGQNGTTRPHLFIATPASNQLRTSVQQNRPTAPININSNSTVMLRTGQVIPIQQSNSGVLRPPSTAALPVANPRTGIQQIRQPVYKHPAPLPVNPQHTIKPGVKLPPPKPQLKIAKTVNGIMLSWSMALDKDGADIASYQLYAYQESSAQAPSTALWKKVGDVKALPLPMACTLTQFVEGHKYHFSVRAVDAHSRIGPFSVPGSILLTSSK